MIVLSSPLYVVCSSVTCAFERVHDQLCEEEFRMKQIKYMYMMSRDSYSSPNLVPIKSSKGIQFMCCFSVDVTSVESECHVCCI